MRKKVDLNEYSFFLKAKGETAVTITIFRKDEKVVSKEFNSSDESFWDLFKKDEVRREQLFMKAKEWGSHYLKQMFNNEKEYSRLDIIEEISEKEVTDEYINNILEKSLPKDKESLIIIIKLMCEYLKIDYDDSIEKADFNTIRERAKILRYKYHTRPIKFKLN